MEMAMPYEVVCLITRVQLEPLNQSTLQGQKECPDLIYLVHERQEDRRRSHAQTATVKREGRAAEATGRRCFCDTPTRRPPMITRTNSAPGPSAPPLACSVVRGVLAPGVTTAEVAISLQE
ncbi:hypothetical protein BHE74_00030992 [Ensete ventricosum]|nr:hypothetical protein BHE74_00030992 [Ensete ventricosum]